MAVLQYLLILMALFGVGVTARAETPDVEGIEARLKQRGERVQQISVQLDAGDVSDATLDSQLRALVGFQDDNQDDAQASKAALDGPTKRLGDLGPPPAEGQPPEPADIARLRKSLTDEVSHLTGLSKEVDLSQARVDRLISRASSLQGSRRLSSISKRSMSPFSSTLWKKAAADIPPALDGLAHYLGQWWRDHRARGTLAANLALLAAALVGAIALLMLPPRGARWRRFEAQLDDNPSPSAAARRRRAAERLMSRGLLAMGAGGLLYGAALETAFVGMSGKSFAVRLWIGSTLLVIVWNYAQGAFSPRKREWRVVMCSAKAAGPLRTLFVSVFGLLVIDRILATAFKATEAGVELVLAQAVLANCLFAVLLWRALSPKLWDSEGTSSDPVATPESPSVLAADEPVKARSVWSHDVVRSAGRLLAVLILVATALAYIRFSNFVFQRAVLLAVFLIIVWAVHVLALWGLNQLPVAKRASANAPRGGKDSSREQLGLWLNLALGLTLLALSVPSFLLIVGFGWLDVRGWFGLLSADIRIGAVSISFTAILTAVVVFLIVSMGTKWATRVVDKKLLKRSGLDEGERNSITTLVNYVGIVTAILVALPIAGMGLSKLAIVAGALSVGIGFGLQGIVNNFVSGLILLFERPIKMGDWIVVPSGQGYVKHVGARATEIQTFDRASILVPNSELISSAVQNWFYKGRFGRLRVDVGVSYGSDPEQVRNILLDCAKQHHSVLSDPAASVRWTAFGDSSLDFELRAYVRNVDDSYEVCSDLRFTIFKAFKEAGVEIPFPQLDLHHRPDGIPVNADDAPEDDRRVEQDK